MFSQISSLAVETHRCNINNVENNDQIKVYPGETITIGLKAYDLIGNTTYAQVSTRLTKFEEYWFNHSRQTYTEDITHL